MAVSLYTRFSGSFICSYMMVLCYFCIINLLLFYCNQDGFYDFENCYFRFATSEVFFNRVFVEIYDEANEALAICYALLLALGARLA